MDPARSADEGLVGLRSPMEPTCLAVGNDGAESRVVILTGSHERALS